MKSGHIGGNVMYRYNTYVRWCYNGKKVTKATNYYSYFSKVNYLYNEINPEVIRKNNASGKNRQIHAQGKIKIIGAVKLPAFTYHPWNKVTVTKSGTSSLKSGE